MKMLYNVPKVEITTLAKKYPTKEEWIRDNEGSAYFCRRCGKPDDIGVDYTETNYGIADLVSADGELDNYNITDSDNFNITSYRCAGCDHEEERIENIVIEDIEEAWEAFKAYNDLTEEGEEEEEQ